MNLRMNLKFFCCILFLSAAETISAAQLATSSFQIPPFTAGIPVEGQGGSEPGWAAPWRKLGGFNDRGNVVTTPNQDGSGAVQLFTDGIFGTSVEREWADIVPVVRVDAYVFVSPGATMDGQIVTDPSVNGEINPRRAGSWRINNMGGISVFDKTVNNFVNTGFFTLPNQWNKYSLIADSNSSTYTFLFKDQPFNSPHPLPYLNSMFYVNGINLRALGMQNSYVDHITVTAIPEPSTVVLGGMGMIGALVMMLRRRLTAVNG